MNTNTERLNLWRGHPFRFAFCLLAPTTMTGFGQSDNVEEELYELSPLVVDGSDDEGYRATSTLAGTRIRTNLSDVGSAISVVPEEFLNDTGSTCHGTRIS